MKGKYCRSEFLSNITIEIWFFNLLKNFIYFIKNWFDSAFIICCMFYLPLVLKYRLIKSRNLQAWDSSVPKTCWSDDVDNQWTSGQKPFALLLG